MSLLSQLSSLPLAFGGAALSGQGAGYGFGHISDEQATDLLLQAFECGFVIFDTAPIYGFGESERRIGKAFKAIREDVFIVSKSGVTWDNNKRVDIDNSAKVTQKMLEQSLLDLQSDYIDLYMIHWPDRRTDIRKPMEVLSKALEQGKIKHIGLCNTNISELEKAQEIEKVEVVQSQLNYFEREVCKDLFDYISEHKISFMSWGTLDKGILTSRVDAKREKSKDYDQFDCRRSAPWWKSSEVLQKIAVVEQIKEELEDSDFSLLELALSFNLSFKELDVALVGFKNKTQLEQILKALKHLPSDDFRERILKKYVY